MDMKKYILIYFFISMLVDREKEWNNYKTKVVIKKGGGIVIKKVNKKKEK
jgi:hypothetical protein